MLYAILCYHDEAKVDAWTREEDEAVLAKRALVTDELEAAGRLGPSMRLMSTPSATSVRSGTEPMVIDGPFAETKEQLLGLYVVDCASQADAVEIARRLGRDETGGFEIRPLKLYKPGAIKA
ncbi:MAG: YciI family protein [Alphaproteobacteria bacterium]